MLQRRRIESTLGVTVTKITVAVAASFFILCFISKTAIAFSSGNSNRRSSICGTVAGWTTSVNNDDFSLSLRQSLQRIYSKNNRNNENDDGNDMLSSLSVPATKNGAFLRNEFSRIIQIDRVLFSPGGYSCDDSGGVDDGNNNSGSSSSKRKTTQRTFTPNRQRAAEQRDYTVSVTAKETERVKLADRFQLKQISKLTAEVTLRPAITVDSISTDFDSGGPPTIEAEGTIEASVTQTCVRTGEKFDMDLEFPINAVVRPIESNLMDFRRATQDELEDDNWGGSGNGKKKKKTSKLKKQQNRQQRRQENVRDLNNGDMFDLQKAIEQAEMYENLGLDEFGDGSVGRSTNVDVIEDEAIYSTKAPEKLDVGELVSQSFYLQLDFYPTKPGQGEQRQQPDDEDEDDDSIVYTMSTIA